MRKRLTAHPGRVLAVVLLFAAAGISLAGWAAASGGRTGPARPAASLPTGGTLYAVAATSARNAWAVGFASNGRTINGTTLIAHWNGSTWTRAPSPGPPGDPHLYGVAASSERSAWAVGYNSDTGKTLTEHWNGTAWEQVPSPTPLGGGMLSSVTAASSCSVWAAGNTGTTSNPLGFTTLMERWDGTSWKQVPISSPSGDGFLTGMAETSACRPWAVGAYDLKIRTTLIERWNGSTWSASPHPRS